VLHHGESVESEEFLGLLAEALVLSGLAMSVAGTSQPCSGACHEISHAVDARYSVDGRHGEQVAVGVLFASYLRNDGSAAPLDAALRRHGVPRLPADIGLTTEQICDVVAAAPATRPDRYTMLVHLAMDEAEIRNRVDDFLETFDRAAA